MAKNPIYEPSQIGAGNCLPLELRPVNGVPSGKAMKVENDDSRQYPSAEESNNQISSYKAAAM